MASTKHSGTSLKTSPQVVKSSEADYQLPFINQFETIILDPWLYQSTWELSQNLDQLKMKDTGFVYSYILDFRALSNIIVGWDEHPLMYQFHKGLPSRILEQLVVHQGSLDSLQDLMEATLEIDTRYLELIEEKKFGKPSDSGSSWNSSIHSSPPPSSLFTPGKEAYGEAESVDSLNSSEYEADASTHSS
ncbi:hypothetical protein BY996DRAFT_6600140 [Phakopsora pachyrhizi]|nr:hypothetical protein BY996DRAFT_6600140 [Phakopsora pachyrhizi]